MFKKTLLLTFGLFLSLVSFAGDGYHIKIKLNGFEQDSIFFGYQYGDKQYVRDTIQKNKDGWFHIEGDEALQGGVYMIVIPPDNKYFELLIDENNQNFTVETSYDDLVTKMKIKGSKDNILFYDYLNFLSSKRPEAEALQKQITEAGEDENAKKPLQEKLDKLNESVQEMQQKIVKEHPLSLPAAIIKATFAIDYPAFEGDEKEVQMQKWLYTKEHYFDNINLSDDRLARTNLLFQRIDYYINKLEVQHPDSLNKAIDFILEKMDPKGENFKFYVVHFLNTYAKSKIVGMDAVYVHIVDKYYKTDMAYWTPDSTMQKIVENADALEPILIGKTAPDIQMQKKDGTKVKLSEVESPFTVIYVWDPDCGHCKKAAPIVVDFYEKFKDKGVTIFSICGKFTDEVPSCWDTIEEKGFDNFMNVVDPYHRSKYKVLYNIKSTPQIFILDKDKKIIMKRIGAEQLSEVMDQIILQEQREMEGK
ncbi:MAG: redoxin domain-containing protein [Saprospiraceae bacterium]|nr:redoxin domain-containing protein [Saprospiraceae bacterium]